MTETKYDLLMFDMDGTFMDSRKFHLQVFYRFLNRYVRPMTWEEVDRGLGNTVRDIFQSAGVGEQQMEAVYEKLDRFCKNEINDLVLQIPVVEGIGETLDGLKELGIRRALLTNSMETVAGKMLTLHHLMDKFDMISGADFSSLDKCSRSRAIETAMNAGKILYIGDSESDIELAIQMGYDSCFVKTKYSWYKDLDYINTVLKPTYTVTSLKDILNVAAGGPQKIKQDMQSA